MPEALDLSTPEAQEAIKAEAEKVAAGLKAKNDELLRELKAARGKVKSTEGLDPEKYEEALAFKAEYERRQHEEKGEYEKALALKDAEYQKALKAREAREQKFKASLRQEKVTSRLTAAVARAKGVPELLLHELERAVQVKETDEDFVPFVVDAAGQPRTKDVGGELVPFSFDDLVEEYKQHPVFSRAFEGTGSSGSGAPAGSVTGGAVAGYVDGHDPVALGKAADGIIKGTIKVR
mgnify:CR=1 FL=1